MVINEQTPDANVTETENINITETESTTVTKTETETESEPVNDDDVIEIEAEPKSLPCHEPNEEFDVEYIIKALKIADEIHFRVKWAAYPCPIWEPESNLTGCPEKLKEFYMKNGDKIPEASGASIAEEEGFNIDNWLTTDEIVFHIDKYSKIF